MLQIKKRDGTIVPFNQDKIIIAINKAFLEVDGVLYETSTAEDIAADIEKRLLKHPIIATIEEIQDWVEEYLMRSERQDVARAYVRFRYRREIARNYEADFIKLWEEKLQAKNVQNQNANLDEHSFGGRQGEAADVMFKKYALEHCVSPMARKNHENNEIYIHDLNSYPIGMHNCLSVPFDDLLSKGFNTRQCSVRPAQSINTAFQLVAVLFQIQSLQQFGGVAATHIDHTMVPYVRKSFLKHYIAAWLKDKPEFIELDLMTLLFDNYEETRSTVNGITFKIFRNKFEDWVDKHKGEFFTKTGLQEKDFKFANKEKFNPKYYQQALYDTIIEAKQAVEGAYHNLNTLQSRSGNQLPFSSLNYGTCIEPEGRLITKWLLDISIEGLGTIHSTSIFPCGIFQYMKGVNDKEGTPNYDLFREALRSTAQRLYPNYANVDWSGNEGYDPDDPRTYFSTMGCRTANGWDINGFKQLKDGRGNICPVTIILPTLAMEAKIATTTEEERIKYFMALLNKKIYEAKTMLIERFEWICSQDPNSAKFMYENNTMAGYVPEEGIRSALKHGTLAMGQLGLAETLQLLINCDHTTKKGMELAKQIEQLFKDRCAQFKQEEKLNFGVYMTPAENLCYTAMKKFKDKYGEIPKVSDRDYFTNSIHVPVYHEISPFDKIDIEAQLTSYSSAGCITYVELDAGVKNNIDALETIVTYAMDKDIPYFAINVPCDTCQNCGYTDELNGVCPVCESTNIKQLRRVTG